MNAWLRRGIRGRVYVYNGKPRKVKRIQPMFTISVEDLPTGFEIKYGEVIGVELEIDTSTDSKMKASLFGDNEGKRVFVFISEEYWGNGIWHGNLAYTIPLQDVPSSLDFMHAKHPIEVGLKIITEKNNYDNRRKSK